MHCLAEDRTHHVQEKNRAFLLLVNKSLLQEQFVCSPTSILILFISSFFLSALAALFCFSIHLLSSRLQRESVVSSALMHNTASVTVRNSATNYFRVSPHRCFSVNTSTTSFKKRTSRPQDSVPSAKSLNNQTTLPNTWQNRRLTSHYREWPHGLCFQNTIHLLT